MPVVLHGVQPMVSRPHTYTMNYFNGSFTYTERFVMLRCDPAYVASAGATLAGVVRAIAGATAAIPAVGPFLSLALQAGASWYAAASLEPDGSVVIQMAHHYCGTKAGGIDLTASPIPGVDPRRWQAGVNDTIRAIETGELRGAPLLRTWSMEEAAPRGPAEEAVPALAEKLHTSGDRRE